MHLRPRRKLAAQLKTVCRPVTMLVFYHTLVTKRPNYLEYLLGMIQALQAVLALSLTRLEQIDQIDKHFSLDSIEFHHAMQLNLTGKTENPGPNPSQYFQQGHKDCLNMIRKIGNK